MRLTLRTMLAYLDEILEPADRDDIAQKIADSPFAAGLMARIRDSMRNPSLPAPKLMDQGMGLDPNTVAEYLDNTLAGERVPEFETVCLPPQEPINGPLESDVFLAEVAACHQILTMVLGHPAQIDPDMKRRMYAIIDQTQHPQSEIDPDGSESLRLVPLDDGLSSGTLSDFEFKPRRRKPEVPEYLRQPTSRVKWKPILAVVILVIVLLGAITMALGPPDRRNPLLAWMFRSQPQQAQNQVATKPPSVLVGSPNAGQATATPPVKTPPPVVTSSGQPPIVASAPSKATSPAPAQASSANPNSVAELAPTNAGANPGVSSPAASAPVIQPSVDNRSPTVASSMPETPPTAGPTAAGPPATDAARASTPAPLAVPPQSTKIADNNRPMPAADAPVPGDTTPDNSVREKNPPAPPIPAVELKPVGRFNPAKQTVLLRYDGNITHQWLQVPTAIGAPLFGGDQLLVLPNYRPTLNLTGLTLQIPPETMLQLEAPDAAGVLGVKLFFGQLVAMTTGKSDTQLRLNLGIANGTVTFVDADATLAVDVNNTLKPGSNPEQDEPIRTVDFYAVGGNVQWTAADGSIVTIRASQRLTLPANPSENGGQAATVQANPPKWISPESLNSLDERCVEMLSTDLDNNKPLLIALREMAARPQVEQHAFAAECLAFLGEYDTPISALNDPDRKLRWPADIATLRDALTRGPQVATAVREAFEKQRGEEPGKHLYRMLLGYTKEQLQGGEAERLVDALDDDSLDFRELAFVNLMEITGKTHAYHPEDPPAARSQRSKQWREDLRTGAIVPHDESMTQK